jgi:hypothetical protein
MSSSSSAGGGGGPKGGGSSSSSWLSRVNELQQSKITPEMRAALNRRAEASRSARMTQMMTRNVQMRSADVYSSVTAGLREARELESLTLTRGVPAAGGAAAAAPASAALSGPVSWGAMASTTVSNVRAGGAQRTEAESAAMDARSVLEEEERTSAFWGAVAGGGLAESSQQLEMAVAAASAAPALAADANGELASLLEQLREEPEDPEEMSAKFAIFETYMNTVVQLRNEVVAAVERAREHLEGGAFAGIQRGLRALDAHEYLGAAEATGVWLVYGMMRTASQNHARLSNLLRDVETKLALVAADADCPICLEPLGVGEGKKAPKMLVCCHRTCVECWNEWAAVHPNPFCPLCRNVEFIEVLAKIAAETSG